MGVLPREYEAVVSNGLSFAAKWGIKLPMENTT